MSEGDYGVFVTLSDYTVKAKVYLEQHTIIRGIIGSELVDLVLRYYDKLDDKYQYIIPLKQVYMPDVNDEVEQYLTISVPGIVWPRFSITWISAGQRKTVVRLDDIELIGAGVFLCFLGRLNELTYKK